MDVASPPTPNSELYAEEGQHHTSTDFHLEVLLTEGTDRQP